MCNRREDDLKDENKSYETAITTASTMVTWQLGCLDIKIIVPMTAAV